VSELRLRRIATVELAQAICPPSSPTTIALRQAPGRHHRGPGGARRGTCRCSWGVAIIGKSPADNTCRSGPAGFSSAAAAPTPARRIEVRELLDGRLLALHDGVIRGTTPAPDERSS